MKYILKYSHIKYAYKNLMNNTHNLLFPDLNRIGRIIPSKLLHQRIRLALPQKYYSRIDLYSDLKVSKMLLILDELGLN